MHMCMDWLSNWSGSVFHLIRTLCLENENWYGEKNLIRRLLFRNFIDFPCAVVQENLDFSCRFWTLLTSKYINTSYPYECWPGLCGVGFIVVITIIICFWYAKKRPDIVHIWGKGAKVIQKNGTEDGKVFFIVALQKAESELHMSFRL